MYLPCRFRQLYRQLCLPVKYEMNCLLVFCHPSSSPHIICLASIPTVSTMVNFIVKHSLVGSKGHCTKNKPIPPLLLATYFHLLRFFRTLRNERQIFPGPNIHGRLDQQREIAGEDIMRYLALSPKIFVHCVLPVAVMYHGWK